MKSLVVVEIPPEMVFAMLNVTHVQVPSICNLTVRFPRVGKEHVQGHMACLSIQEVGPSLDAEQRLCAIQGTGCAEAVACINPVV
jgi:hypothetical protein